MPARPSILAGVKRRQRRTLGMGGTLALAVIGAVQAVYGVYMVSSGQDDSVFRAVLTVLWLGIAVAYSWNFIARLRRGEPLRSPHGYGSWWHL